MFTIIRFDSDSNIFMILKKDDVSGGFFKSLPIVVHGFIKIEGSSYIDSHVSYRNIADDVTTKALDNLVELAKLEFFNMD